MAWFRTEKAFLEAAANGDIDTLRDYLDKRKDYIEARDKNSGDTALILAARNNQVETMRFLVAKGASIRRANNETQEVPMHAAVRAGAVDALTFLLSQPHGADHINLSSDGGTPLQLAITQEQPGILKQLLDTGRANLAQDPPALFFAVENNKPEAVKILLEAGADANLPRLEQVSDYSDFFGHRYITRSREEKRSPLNRAVRNNNPDIVNQLLEAGAKPQPDETPLIVAAGLGNIEIATALLDHGADIDQQDHNRRTALHAAAQGGHVDMARLLLERGIRRNVMDKEKREALSYAQQFALKELIDVLQDPAKVKVKPVPPKPQPQVVAEPKPQPQVQKPVVTVQPAPNGDSETWQLAGRHSVAHVSTFPALGRRLTEIFNFESRERVTIAENLNLKTESMGPHESFDAMSEDSVLRALREYRRLGGKADDAHVLKNSLGKLQMKK